ncbi:MAG: hypothetical protein AAF497_12270, partial [Planctomycetota bacterium]
SHSMNPDYLVLCGAPILNRNIYTLPRIATINIHWGITNRVRGAESTFWSLYYQIWDGIGITLHKVDEQPDHGSYLAQGRPSLSWWDGEVRCWVKNSQIAARMIVDLLATTESDIKHAGVALDRPGRLFRYRDRKATHDLIRWARHWLLLQGPPLQTMQTTIYHRRRQPTDRTHT